MAEIAAGAGRSPSTDLVAFRTDPMDDDFGTQGLICNVLRRDMARRTLLGGHRLIFVVVTFGAADPEVLKVLLVRALQPFGVDLVVAGDTLHLEVFGVHLMGEGHFSDSRRENAFRWWCLPGDGLRHILR